MNTTHRISGFFLTLSGVALLVAATAACGQSCQTKTYTSDADFGTGFSINLNHGTAGQLQVNAVPVPAPYLWVANTSRGTIVRIDTRTGDILGEYHSAPRDFSAPSRYARQPSRTTVDVTGDCWAGNRAETGSQDDPGGSVIKIGLLVGGTPVNSNGVPDANGSYRLPPFDYCTCVDRDGDGLIRTSRGLENILGWVDTNGLAEPNGGPDLVKQAQDECILGFVRTHATSVRHVCVDDQNNVWVGGYNNHAFDVLDGNTGAILTTFQHDVGGYGGLIDGYGVLWSANRSGPAGDGLLRYDTKGTIGTYDDSWTHTEFEGAYGLAIDSTGDIWNTRYSMDQVARFDALGGMTPDFSVWTQGASSDRGVAVTWSDNDVWVANSGEGIGFDVSRLDRNGNVRKVIDLRTPGGQGDDAWFPTGVAVDAAGKVWATCLSSNTAKRIDPADALGKVDLTVDLYPNAEHSLGPAGPYNYSDMTGYVGLGALKTGMWDDVYDSGTAGARWTTVSWNYYEECEEQGYPGVSVRVQIRADDTEAGLTRKPFREVSSHVQFFPAEVGRFVETRVILNGAGYGNDFEPATLCDLRVTGQEISGRDCDTNGIPDSCEFDDCNLDCVPDECNISCANRDGACGTLYGGLCGREADIDADGAVDACEWDCNSNGVPDHWEIKTGASRDCNFNGIPDECEVAWGWSEDCDGNGSPDECSGDCNANGIFDECDIFNCQPGAPSCQDCNGNGVPDGCDLSSCELDVLWCQDCDANGVPDECDLQDCAPDDPACADCNENGVQDGCDIAQWTSYDRNGNRLPDECEDCNENGMPDECEFTCEGGCGAIPYCHHPMYKECNSNGVPDACEPDCNNSDIPDDCDRCGLFLGDRDRDCDTDLWDFAFFQDCYEAPGASVTGECACVADMNTNGVLDLSDYVAFEAQLGGPSVGGQMMMGGGGGEGMMAMIGPGVEGESLDAGLLDSPSAAVALEVPPESDPWTYASADLSFELRPVGGGAPVTILAAHTTYEVHYAAATDRVGFYLLIVVAGSTAQGLTGAAPPAAGDWSGAGHFLFRDAAAEAGAPVPAEEYGQGWYRTHSVTDDFFPALDTAGTEGILCTITTGEPGELALELYMDWADPDTFRLVMLEAQATLTVAPGP